MNDFLSLTEFLIVHEVLDIYDVVDFVGTSYLRVSFSENALVGQTSDSVQSECLINAAVERVRKHALSFDATDRITFLKPHGWAVEILSDCDGLIFHGDIMIANMKIEGRKPPVLAVSSRVYRPFTIRRRFFGLGSMFQIECSTTEELRNTFENSVLVSLALILFRM